MRRAPRDWVDALARRTAGDVVPSPPLAKPDVAAFDDRFSRTTSLKLALAGVASLSLGIWPAPRARAQGGGDCFTQSTAQGRGECFTKCLECHEKELQRRFRSCEDVFAPRQFKKSDWRLYVGLFHSVYIGAKRDYVLGALVLQGLCYDKALWDVGGEKNHCYEGCEAGCRQRSVQSSSGRSAATCEVTPPSHAPPPTIPPIPNPTEGVAVECANCSMAGGECCYGADPTHLCGCASYDPDGPETACQRVGCR